MPELRRLGEVVVVAPATEQSAVGHSVTLTNPLIVQEILDEERRPLGWAVEGRPADCVKLALRELLPAPPDLIVSGLNAGSNAGINVLYSGTVAAAIEGAFFRVTSIACSLEYSKPTPPDFARGAALARRVVEQILARRPAAGSLFNVNIPDLERHTPRGVRVVPQNLAAYRGELRPPHRPARPGVFLVEPGIRLPRPAPRHGRDGPGRGMDQRDAVAIQPDA